MVRFERGPAPDGFANLARSLDAEWLTEAVLDDSTISNFWATVRPRLRPAADELFIRSHGKCAFCESVLAVTSSLQIEHFRPKKHYPQFAFQWTNWLPACPTCNNKKASHFPMREGVPSLVDPATEEPGEFLGFSDQFISARNQRGAETIDLVALNREGLNTERSWHLERLQYALLFARLIPDAGGKAVAREFLRRAIQPFARYSAMSRDFVEKYAPRFVQSGSTSTTIAADIEVGLDQLIERYRDQLKDLQ